MLCVIKKKRKHGDKEIKMGVKDRSVPDLVSGEEVSDRFLRFDIVKVA